MRIALLGYGKMGKMVEAIAVREGWDVGPRLDIEDNPGGRGITADSMKGVDVAVEFSQPEAVMANIVADSRAGVNLVVGTTGWMAGRERAERLVADSGIGLIHGANFSPGMNLFFEIVAHASRLVGSNLRYDSFMMEEHHREKKDAPSGTALDLRDLMRPHLGDRDLSITSVRAGFIPGTHVIGFDSEADTLLLEHRARNRQGFAEGAFLAARWIVGKKGMYDFRRVFREIVGQP